MHNRYRDAIKENLFKLVHRKDDEEETFVKLLVVYVMTAIFFLKTSMNEPTFVARYANDLTSLGHYTWAHAIHRWLMADIPTTPARVQQRC